MPPLDQPAHYGVEDRSFLDADAVKPELLPDRVRQLRWKLNQKAKNEPKFRFYALYDRIYRRDVLKAAWKQTGKRGKAAGVDGIRVEDVKRSEGGVEAFVEAIHQELKEKRYRPSPVKRVYIPKAGGQERPLGIPTLKDRLVQTATLFILEPIFEADFEECSYGFRCGRNAHQALEAIGKHLKRGKTEIYDADIRGYFDSIPHDKLISCVKMRVVDGRVLKLIRGWLKAPIVEYRQKRPQPPRKNDKGTPQGGVISPLLANIYLHWFDKVFHREGGPYHWAQARLVRYADDFVVLAKYQGEQLQKWIKSKLEDWMGLELSLDKTQVIDLRKPGQTLDFLGFTFRYDRDLHGCSHRYLNLFPSKRSEERERDKLRELTSSKMCFKPATTLIRELNKHLSGWKGYYNYGYPRKVFGNLNHFLDCRLIKHLNRRSQRRYKWPHDKSKYAYLRQIGLPRL